MVPAHRGVKPPQSVGTDKSDHTYGLPMTVPTAPDEVRARDVRGGAVAHSAADPVALRAQPPTSIRLAVVELVGGTIGELFSGV
jgi:hypothetical protein